MTEPAQDADDVRTWGKDCFASTCPYCRCKGFHSEFCEGFEINDPAATVAAHSDGPECDDRSVTRH